MGPGLRTGLLAIAASATCVALWACSAPAPRDAAAAEAERAAMARVIAETATRVAVSKRGARVCRETSIGISERDWVRATVVDVAGDRIRVKVDDPGRFPQALDGIQIARDVVLWDTSLNWTPCS